MRFGKKHMNTTIMLALLTLVTSGLVRFFWIFAASNRASGPSFMLVQGLGFCAVFLAAHLVQTSQPFRLSAGMAGVAIVSGVLGGIGVLALYLAFRLGGQGSVLFPIAALSVIVSVPLTFLVYHEPINIMKVLGLGFGIISIVFLTRS